MFLLMLWWTVACQEQCRGHGDCLPLAYYGEQVCSCHVGWEGEFCDKRAPRRSSLTKKKAITTVNMV